jgi:replicative DNA helicase
MTETRWLYTPAETGSAYVQWADKLRTDPGIDYGCVLDRVLIPLHPGDLMAVVARPGHGKSSFMAYMARRTANRIRNAGRDDRECVVYVTWEQSVEEIEAFFQSGDAYTSTDLAWGRVPRGVVIRRCLERPQLPVWLMGNSVMAADPHRQPMYVDTVFEQIRWLQDKFGLRPVLVCLDYLQIIPVAGGMERNRQVHEAVINAKALALAIGCPIIAGVQASRAVDERRSPIPTLSDAQWSSSIEQTADKQLALFRPIREWPPEEQPAITVGKHQYANTPELLVIRILKQRFDVGCGTYAVRFAPQTLEMADYEVRPLCDL